MSSNGTSSKEDRYRNRVLKKRRNLDVSTRVATAATLYRSTRKKKQIRELEKEKSGKEREPSRHLPWESAASSGIQPRSELLQAGFTLEYKADASTLGER